MDSDHPPIDKTYLELIQIGTVKFTEKLFFELLSESEDYLKESPFREKITAWQERVEYGGCSETTRNRAKKNLKKIDSIRSVTPSNNRGRPLKISGFQVYIKYRDHVADIKSFFDKQDVKPSLKNFLSAYPGYKDCFALPHVQHRTAKAIAFQITCKRGGVSIRQLRRIIAAEGNDYHH